MIRPLPCKPAHAEQYLIARGWDRVGDQWAQPLGQTMSLDAAVAQQFNSDAVALMFVLGYAAERTAVTIGKLIGETLKSAFEEMLREYGLTSDVVAKWEAEQRARRGEKPS